MLLHIQIQVILYHLLAGWLYGLGFSFLQVLTQYRRRSFLTLIGEVLYHALAAVALFFGLLQLNGAVTNIYLVLFFLLGACVYYRFYYPLFYGWFSTVRHRFHTAFHKISVAKSRVLGIIKKNTHRKKRRRDRRGRKKETDADSAG